MGASLEEAGAYFPQTMEIAESALSLLRGTKGSYLGILEDTELLDGGETNQLCDIRFASVRNTEGEDHPLGADQSVAADAHGECWPAGGSCAAGRGPWAPKNVRASCNRKFGAVAGATGNSKFREEAEEGGRKQLHFACHFLVLMVLEPPCFPSKRKALS